MKISLIDIAPFWEFKQRKKPLSAFGSKPIFRVVFRNQDGARIVNLGRVPVDCRRVGLPEVRTRHIPYCRERRPLSDKTHLSDPKPRGKPLRKWLAFHRNVRCLQGDMLLLPFLQIARKWKRSSTSNRLDGTVSEFGWKCQSCRHCKKHRYPLLQFSYWSHGTNLPLQVLKMGRR